MTRQTRIDRLDGRFPHLPGESEPDLRHLTPDELKELTELNRRLVTGDPTLSAADCDRGATLRRKLDGLPPEPVEHSDRFGKDIE